MLSRILRHAFLALTLSFSARASEPEPTINFAIPAGVAKDSLMLFSRQSGCGVICVSEDVRTVRTKVVRGILTPTEAIREMLAETELIATKDDATHAYAVRPRSQNRSPEKNHESKGSGPAVAPPLPLVTNS